MQLLWTWSHSNSNNKAVVRALGSLAMLKPQEAHLVLKGVVYLYQHPGPGAPLVRTPRPWQRWVVELWHADVCLAWARVRSSGPRADGDSTEQCGWQRRPLLAEALTMQTRRPSDTHCSPCSRALFN